MDNRSYETFDADGSAGLLPNASWFKWERAMDQLGRSLLPSPNFADAVQHCDVTKYRLYKLDATGHISDVPRIIKATTDIAAVAEAMLMVDKYDLEIWDRERRVGLIEGRHS